MVCLSVSLSVSVWQIKRHRKGAKLPIHTHVNLFHEQTNSCHYQSRRINIYVRREKPSAASSRGRWVAKDALPLNAVHDSSGVNWCTNLRSSTTEKKREVHTLSHETHHHQFWRGTPRPSAMILNKLLLIHSPLRVYIGKQAWAHRMLQ